MIDTQASQCFNGAKHDDSERRSGGDDLWRERRIEIIARHASKARNFASVQFHAELGIALRHHSAKAVAIKTHWNRADIERERDSAFANSVRRRELEHAGRAERRMTGEVQFLHGCEDAHANALDAFSGLIAPLDERSLGEVEFARDGLHFFGSEAAGVLHSGEWIAAKRRIGEHVDNVVIERG